MMVISRWRNKPKETLLQYLTNAVFASGARERANPEEQGKDKAERRPVEEEPAYVPGVPSHHKIGQCDRKGDPRTD